MLDRDSLQIPGSLNKQDIDTYFSETPFVDFRKLDYVGPGLRERYYDSYELKDPFSFDAIKPYYKERTLEDQGEIVLKKSVSKGIKKMVPKIAYNDTFTNTLKDLSLANNYRMTRTGKTIKGVKKMTGKDVIFTILKLKTGDKKEQRVQERADLGCDYRSSNHLINKENMYYGEANFTKIDELMGCYISLYNQILRDNEGLLYFDPVLNEELENIKDNFDGEEEDYRRMNEILKKMTVTKNTLTNRRIKEVKFNCKIKNKDFIKKYNNKIKYICKKYGDIKQLFKEADLDRYLLPENGEIDSDYFYMIRREFTKCYRKNTGRVSCVIADIDFDDSDKGTTDFAVMLRLFSHVKCYIAKNKTKRKKNHATVLFPLGEFTDAMSIRYICDILKIMGLNDINHKYYIGKNIFNFTLFKQMQSNSEKLITELISNFSNPFGRAYFETFKTYMDVYGKSIEDFESIEGCIDFIYRKLREKTPDLDPDGEVIYEKKGFLMDNFNWYKKEFAEIFPDRVLERAFSNDNYKSKYKDVNLLENENKEKLKEEIRKQKIKRIDIEHKLNILKEKKRKEKLEKKKEEYFDNLLLFDRKYYDDNHGVKEFLEKVYNTKTYTTLKDFDKDFMEISVSRRFTLGRIAYALTYNYNINFKEDELCSFILNHAHICNSDYKFEVSEFYKIIQTGYNDATFELHKKGFRKKKDKFSNISRACATYNSINKGMLKKVDLFIEQFGKIPENELMLNIKKLNKNSKHLDEFKKLFELCKKKNFRKIRTLFIDAYTKALSKNLSRLDEKQKELYIKKIRKQSKLILRKIKKMLLKCKVICKVICKVVANHLICYKIKEKKLSLRFA